MMLARYVEGLVAEHAPDQETQDAVEWAIFSNWVKLTYLNRKEDHGRICEMLSEIVEAYRRVVAENEAVRSQLTLL